MMAKAELNQCGMPNGFSTKFAYLTPNSSAANIFKAEQAALAKVKIVITAVTQDQSNYYSNFVGSPANIKSQGIGMAYLGWSPDFPTGIGFYNSIANGANILPTGNSNYASLNDPVVNKILNDAPKGRTSEADWQKLDRQIMKDAVYLPYAWSKGLYYRNPRMTNVTCDNALAYGIYDFVNIGVKD
jgi:peptide/nickel transport system substrate-binding protein